MGCVSVVSARLVSGAALTRQDAEGISARFAPQAVRETAGSFVA
ncbi:MAG TPA: hypothetical protein VFM71_01780 [Gemmatimonadaceae bacterium]|nr:hypothetical protein [Gemmatimonadaceae bacterium]